MPQIAQLAETYASQLFWLLIFFGFTFFVVGRHMVPKVMATVDARERQIVSDLAAAEAARKASDAAEQLRALCRRRRHPYGSARSVPAAQSLPTTLEFRPTVRR